MRPDLEYFADVVDNIKDPDRFIVTNSEGMDFSLVYAIRALILECSRLQNVIECLVNSSEEE